MTDETKNEETEGLEETSKEESEESVSDEESAAEGSKNLEETSEEESAEDASEEDDSEEEADEDDESDVEASFEGDEDEYEDEDDERDEFDDAFDHLDESEASDDEGDFEDEDEDFEEEEDDSSEFESDDSEVEVEETSNGIDGLAAYFDGPNETLVAAAAARDAEWDSWDVFTPFPIHGIEDAMGIGRSWLPWVTFGAGGTGFLTANALQFGTLTFDWPMIIGGKPHAPWPSFVPIMFELTVLIGGVTTALVMLIAAGCFRKPKIIDPDITNDRFVLWIASDDPNFEKARAFMQELDPVEIREITFGS